MGKGDISAKSSKSNIKLEITQLAISEYLYLNKIYAVFMKI